MAPLKRPLMRKLCQRSMKRISGYRGIRLPEARRPILFLVMLVSLSFLIMAPGGKAQSQTPCIQIVDDQGKEVTLPYPACRIIVLYGAYNEILAAMGLEDRLTEGPGPIPSTFHPDKTEHRHAYAT